MFNLFRKSSAIDEDFYEWTVALTAWVIENFDGIEQIKKTPLVTPTSKFFPARPEQNHAYAEHIAHQIATHAQMLDWPYQLVSQSKRAPSFVGDIAMKDIDSLPLGTFSTSKSDNTKNNPTVTISYDPELTANPESLISTLAHEFGHFLMTNAKSPPPGGWEMEEPTTDGLAIFMGFGIFIANSATFFNNNDQGYAYGRSGYLCEGEILHALSAFLIISEKNINPAITHLKPHLGKRLKKIHTEMSSRDILTL